MATQKEPHLPDEHTAAPDPRTAARRLELSEQIAAKDNLTALTVTHSMCDAIRYDSRLIL